MHSRFRLYVLEPRWPLVSLGDVRMEGSALRNGECLVRVRFLDDCKHGTYGLIQLLLAPVPQSRTMRGDPLNAVNLRITSCQYMPTPKKTAST
jgi:hypothetical protein